MPLVEAIPFSRSHSFYWKLFIFMETIASSGRHSNQWKPFIFVETIPFYWKSFLVVEAIPFIGSHSFYFFSGKPFFLVEIIARS